MKAYRSYNITDKTCPPKEERAEWGHFMVAGFSVLLLAGLCQGSFGIGYKRYPPFSWAVFWAVYSFMCLFTSTVFTWVTAPEMWRVFSEIPLGTLAVPLCCGALWGISAIGFSKGIDLVGMSMVYGISMGISTVVGSVVPMLVNDSVPRGGSAAVFAAGLALILTGVILITKAGVMRDGKRNSSVIGIALAMLSGLGSGAMNVGFSSAAAEEVGSAFSALGYSAAAVSSGKWLPVLAGGCIVGIICCLAGAAKSGTLRTLTERGALKRSGILFGVSIVWFAALLMYGLASDMLGSLGDTAGWILFNALALIISSVWGLAMGEWKGSNKARRWLFAGNAALVAAWVFIAAV